MKCDQAAPDASVLRCTLPVGHVGVHEVASTHWYGEAWFPTERLTDDDKTRTRLWMNSRSRKEHHV
jgi:hypothetical protein